MKRLEQLASQQKLSNDEMKEADKLTKDLQGRYGDFGVTIDTVSGSLNLAAESMKKFMDSMNAKALQELEKELKEGEKNFKGLQKQADNTGWYWRSVFANATLGSVDTGEDVQERLGEQMAEQMKKNNEIRKKITQIKGGEDAVNVAKGEGVLLDEKLAEGTENRKEALRKLEEAEKGIASTQRNRERERRATLENEITDMKERNNEYKKYLNLLIDEERRKPESEQNQKNIAQWENQLFSADAELDKDLDRILDKYSDNFQKTIDTAGMSELEKELYEAKQNASKNIEEYSKIIDAKIAKLNPNNDHEQIEELQKQKIGMSEAEYAKVQKVRDKAKIDTNSIAETEAERKVLDARSNLNAAYDSKDAEKIRQAKEELKKAKQDLEATSFQNVQAALQTAQAEYQHALDAFNNAKTEDEKAVAGQKLIDAEKKLDDASANYETMSENKYEKQLDDAMTGTKEKDELAGTFSAYEMGNVKGNMLEKTLEKQLKEQLVTNRLLQQIYQEGGAKFA
jgi:hypothetical protein